MRTDTRQFGESDSGSTQVETTYSFRTQSRRWVKIHEESGEVTDTGGAAPDWESSSIHVWMFDEVIVQFQLGGSQDMDYGIRFPRLDDGGLLTNVHIRDYDTAAILDIVGIFGVTGVDVKAADVYYQMYLDHTIPKHLIRLYVENDHATDDPGTFTVTVYGRLLR